MNDAPLPAAPAVRIPVPRLVRPRAAWLLAGLVLLALPAAGFALFGALPVRVEGRTLLVAEGERSALVAPGDGWLRRWRVAVGAEVDSGAVLCALELPGLRAAVEDARSELDELVLFHAEERARRERLGELRRAELAARQAALDAADAVPEDSLRSRRAALLSTRRGELERGLIDREEGVALREEEAARHRELFARGQLARVQLDAAEQAVREAEQARDAQRTALAALALEEDELAAADQEAARRAAERAEQRAGLALERRRLEAAEREAGAAEEREQAAARRALYRLEERLAAESVVRAPAAGRLLERAVAEGQRLAAGQAVGSLVTGGGTLRALAYLSLVDGAQVATGQPALLALDGFPRARYGSLRAVVESVSALPVSPGDARELSGHPALAQELTGDERWIRVWLQLERDAEGFVWTSAAPPEQPLGGGLPGAARIEVGSRRPVGLFLPRLERALEEILR